MCVCVFFLVNWIILSYSTQDREKYEEKKNYIKILKMYTSDNIVQD